MKRQKTERNQVSEPCKCEEYKQIQQKIKANLAKSLNVNNNTQQKASLYKLIKIQIIKYQQQQNLIQQIDKNLRLFIKQDHTISYRQTMNIVQMIDSLIHKIKKQKSIHHDSMIKERDIMNVCLEQKNTALAQIDYLKELLIEEQKLQEAWKIEAIKHEKSIQVLKKQVQDYKSQILSLKQLNQKVKSTLRLQTQKNESLLKQKVIFSKQYFQKCQQYTKLIKSFKSQKQQLVYKTKVQLNEQLSKYKLQLSMEFNKQKTKSYSLGKNTTRQNPYHLFNHLFAGDVLSNEDQHRYFLVQTIQNHLKSLITRTKLIYRLDPLNFTNVHKYIDGLPHLIILFQTENRQLIAAYSQGSFKAKIISNHRGLLISLKNKKVFKNIKKAIIYDESQIIFGNYDLRIKSGDNKIMSNFGLANSFYDIKGETVNSLLGDGKNREVRLKTYEIYQILLEK